jgi:hypothetical protein
MAESAAANTYDDSGKPKFFKVSGYLLRLANDERLYYLGCPDCNRKVHEDQVGYKCEHCDKVFMTCKEIYMFSAKMGDLSDGAYIQFAKEQGNAILNGLTAKELRDCREEQGTEESKEKLKEGLYHVSPVVYIESCVYSTTHC